MSARHALPVTASETASRRGAVLNLIGVGAVLVLGLSVVVGAFIYLAHQPEAAAPVPTSPTVEIPDTSPVLQPDPAPPVPPTTSQDALAQLPLADTWAVIPSLIEQAAIEDRIDNDIWTVAQPVEQLTALYGAQASDAAPMAALGYWAVEDRTTVAVFAHEGGWLLIGTPARISMPVLDDPNTEDIDETVLAPTVSFAWVRATDFVLSEAEHRVAVDTSKATISLLDRSGAVVMSEAVVLGTPEAPTPTDTHAYVVATYSDAEKQPVTGGEPIALVSSHSATLPTFKGDVAATGIHFSLATSPNSLGCVRVSPDLARALEPLVGVRVDFT